MLFKPFHEFKRGFVGSLLHTAIAPLLTFGQRGIVFVSGSDAEGRTRYISRAVIIAFHGILGMLRSIKRNMAKQHLTITLNLEPSRQFDMIARCLGYVRTGDPSADDLANLNRQIEALGINFDERSDEDEGRDQ